MIITGLLIGAALGFVLQRGRFCVTTAYRDVWLSRNTRWLTAFIIVIAVQSAGIYALQSVGVLHLDSSPLPLAATVIGGFAFGVGIVLAAGCATGTYYRAGEGLIGSWIALIFYAGFSAIMKYGILSGFTAALTSQTVPMTTIPHSLGISGWWLVLVLAAVIAIPTRKHLAADRNRPALATLPPRRTGVAHLLFERRWHPFATAVVIGLIAIAAWPASAVTGRNDGLGITTPSANLISFLTTGDVSAIDWGVLLVLGILVGSFIAAKGSGEFRLRAPSSAAIVKSVFGGALMGFGASLAGGCTIGNAMVKTAHFTWQGWIAFAFMVLGVGAATKLTIRPRTPAPATTDSLAASSATHV